VAAFGDQLVGGLHYTCFVVTFGVSRVRVLTVVSDEASAVACQALATLLDTYCTWQRDCEMPTIASFQVVLWRKTSGYAGQNHDVCHFSHAIPIAASTASLRQSHASAKYPSLSRVIHEPYMLVVADGQDGLTVALQYCTVTSTPLILSSRTYHIASAKSSLVHVLLAERRCIVVAAQRDAICYRE
jgi:hypothetical protein